MVWPGLGRTNNLRHSRPTYKPLCHRSSRQITQKIENIKNNANLIHFLLLNNGEVFAIWRFRFFRETLNRLEANLIFLFNLIIISCYNTLLFHNIWHTKTNFCIWIHFFFKSTNQKALCLWCNNKKAWNVLLRFYKQCFHWLIMSLWPLIMFCQMVGGRSIL